jgi:NTE family protein
VVLGAGGPVGHAFHAGVLAALEHVLGWDVREADLALGTSAGAQVAALVRAGLQGADLVARVSGSPMRPEAEDVARHFVRPSTTPSTEAPTRLRPASLRYVARSLRMPTQVRPGRLVAALLPAGRVRLEPFAAGLWNVFGATWPTSHVWIPSVQLDTGEPILFGAPGMPEIDVGTAVACSMAVPGVFAPVTHGEHRYVDGGVASATHLRSLMSERLDLVIVSSPLSVFAPMRAILLADVRALERGGTPVVVIEPSGPVAGVMGLNPMAQGRGAAVARAAYEATLRAIESDPKLERIRLAF